MTEGSGRTELKQGAILPAVWDVISAGAAASAGFEYVFLSGAALAAAQGYPDRGVTDLHELTMAAKHICDAIGIGLMVDIDEGFGSLPRLTRLVDELLHAGVGSVMMQDVDEPGQSKHSAYRAVGLSSEPSLGDPERLARRIELIRELAGSELKILARTDCLPGQDFTDSFSRLQTYAAAGADWLVPVFAPSYDALAQVAAEYPGRLIIQVIEGETGYVPSLGDAEVLGAMASLLTSQYKNAYTDLCRTYELSLNGSWDEVVSARSDSRVMEEALGLHRPGMRL
jgi:methylisocitrate lyase